MKLDEDTNTNYSIGTPNEEWKRKYGSESVGNPDTLAEGIKYCEDCDHVEFCSFYGTTTECVWKSKTGHWIEKMDACECPYCHKAWDYYDNDTEDFDFCPNCGARMVKDGES